MKEVLKTAIDSSPPIPPIYRLIEQGVDSNIIGQQIYTDFYSANPNMESICLAIEELLKRGDDGLTVIDSLSSDTGEVGDMMRRIKRKNAKEQEQIEEALGINRFKNIVDESTVSSEDEFLEIVYAHAKKNNYTTLSFEECARRFRPYYFTGEPPHLSGKIEEEIITASNTFGVCEAEYLELLGAREILRLRTLKKPSFLLLGSYGVYSARDFRAYANKINSNNQATVIDISDESISKLAGDSINKDKLIQADARKLPFGAETMDHIYTNALLRFLGREDYRSKLQVDIKKLLADAFRVLKPNGSLIMVEYPDTSGNADKAAVFLKEFFALAKIAGFKTIQLNTNSFSFPVRKEAGSSTIDANGFPQYGNSLLGKSADFFPCGIRLVKS